METSDKSSWNLSGYLVNSIGEHFTKAHQAYTNNRPDICFVNLKIIKMKIIANLKEEERSELKKIEEQIIPMMAIWNNKHSKLTGFYSEKEKIKSEVSILPKILDELEKYNETLMDFMENYNLLFSKQLDRTKIN